MIRIFFNFLGLVRLGLVRLDLVWLGLLRLVFVRLSLVRLGQVGQVKVSCKKIVYVGSYYLLYDLVVTFFCIVWQFYIV